MKKQKVTPASLASSATDSHTKGLQQYFTPHDWAAALGAALPDLRRSIADLHCGDGSLLKGLANLSTRELLGLDLDPLAGIKATKHDQWRPHFAHGDVLDLFPLLLETAATFDLLALNPPFSLHWPTHLLPESIRRDIDSPSIDSTLATLRMIPPLLTAKGEAILIANHSTLTRLHRDHPQDFAHAWLWIDLPSFFPGTSHELRIAVLYLAAGACSSEISDLKSGITSLSPATPDELTVELSHLRRTRFPADAEALENYWDACDESPRRWDACTAEMERRRDPTASNANVLLAADGHLRTWVTAFQEASTSIEPGLAKFLRSINHKHPLELTIQRATRSALQHAIDCGVWTIDPAAAAAIHGALADFERERAPLSPISSVQRVGWIDDAEELRCLSDFGPFVAGQSYPLTTETIEWRKTEVRPRWQAGKRSEEDVLARGYDLRITLHPPKDAGAPTHFIYNPGKASDGTEMHSLEVLAHHFALPEVPDITTLRAAEFAANLALLDQLEQLTESAA